VTYSVSVSAHVQLRQSHHDPVKIRCNLELFSASSATVPLGRWQPTTDTDNDEQQPELIKCSCNFEKRDPAGSWLYHWVTPTLQKTVDIAGALSKPGFDFLEIGIPFS